MEIALEAAMPTYGGGPGMLAGDTVRSAADFKVRMIAVTLLHRKGYFNQTLEFHRSGGQPPKVRPTNPGASFHLSYPAFTAQPRQTDLQFPIFYCL